MANILCDRHANAEGVALKMPLVRMLSTLARQRSLRPQIMTYAMAKGLYNTWKESHSDPTFFADVANCILSYISEEVMCDELLHMDSFKLFKHGLYSSCGLVLKATVDLIIDCTKYDEMVNMFIEQKVLNV